MTSEKKKKTKGGGGFLILPTDLMILPTNTVFPTVSEDWSVSQTPPHPTPLDTALHNPKCIDFYISVYIVLDEHVYRESDLELCVLFPKLYCSTLTVCDNSL